MSNDPLAKVLKGQVLPPVQSETHLPVEQPLRGIPLFNRIRYREARRELEEYLAVLRTKNAVIREITETVRVSEDYNRALARTERLDDLRLVEGLKIDAELDAAVEAQLQQHRTSQANSLVHRARMAHLEADAIAAEQRLKALNNLPPKPEPVQQPSVADRVTAEIATIRQQEKQVIAALVGQFENETDLPEEDRELVRDVRFATRNRIAELIEAIGR